MRDSALPPHLICIVPACTVAYRSTQWPHATKLYSWCASSGACSEVYCVPFLRLVISQPSHLPEQVLILWSCRFRCSASPGLLSAQVRLTSPQPSEHTASMSSLSSLPAQPISPKVLSQLDRNCTCAGQIYSAAGCHGDVSASAAGSFGTKGCGSQIASCCSGTSNSSTTAFPAGSTCVADLSGAPLLCHIKAFAKHDEQPERCLYAASWRHILSWWLMQGAPMAATAQMLVPSTPRLPAALLRLSDRPHQRPALCLHQRPAHLHPRPGPLHHPRPALHLRQRPALRLWPWHLLHLHLLQLVWLCCLV